MSDYQEAEDFSFFDVHYKATRAQANAVMMRVCASSEWKRWRALRWFADSYVSGSEAYEHGGMMSIATELAELESQITSIAYKAVLEETQ